MPNNGAVSQCDATSNFSASQLPRETNTHRNYPADMPSQRRTLRIGEIGRGQALEDHVYIARSTLYANGEQPSARLHVNFEKLSRLRGICSESILSTQEFASFSDVMVQRYRLFPVSTIVEISPGSPMRDKRLTVTSKYPISQKGKK